MCFSGSNDIARLGQCTSYVRMAAVAPHPACCPKHVSMCCVAQQSAASESFGPQGRAAAEELLAAVEESHRRKSASDSSHAVVAEVQALVRDSRRHSLRMPTTSPSTPVRLPSIGAPHVCPPSEQPNSSHLWRSCRACCLLSCGSSPPFP